MRRVLLQPKARRMPGVSRKLLIILDSRLRGNDNIVGFMQLCKALSLKVEDGV